MWNLQFSIFRTQKIILVGQANVSSIWFIFSVNFTSQLLGFFKVFLYFVIFYNSDLTKFFFILGIFSHFFPNLGLPVTQKVFQLPVFFLHFLFLVSVFGQIRFVLKSHRLLLRTRVTIISGFFIANFEHVNDLVMNKNKKIEWSFLQKKDSRKRKMDSSLLLLLSRNSIKLIDESCNKIIDSSILREII